MFPLKQSTAGQKIPVILKNSAGAVVTGVTAPTITVSKALGDLAAAHDGAWAEKAGGLYSVQLDATDTSTVGALVVRVVKAGCVDAFVCCWVRANTEADNYGRLGQPAGASIAADIATVGTNAALARRLLQNKFTINLTLSRAELYADDGVTLYATAPLTDSAGAAVTASTTGPINRGPWEIAT